jgi:hypothetical protein
MNISHICEQFCLDGRATTSSSKWERNSSHIIEMRGEHNAFKSKFGSEGDVIQV